MDGQDEPMYQTEDEYFGYSGHDEIHPTPKPGASVNVWEHYGLARFLKPNRKPTKPTVSLHDPSDWDEV